MKIDHKNKKIDFLYQWVKEYDSKHKNVPLTYQRDIDLLKLLITYPGFQEAVEALRKKFYIGTLADSVKTAFEELAPHWPIDVQDLMRDFNIPPTYLQYIQHFIYHDNLYLDKRKYLRPYKILNKPPVLFSDDGKIVRYSKEVILITYRVLTNAEKKEALRELEIDQKIFLHPNATKIHKSKISLDQELELELDMNNRKKAYKDMKIESTYGDLIYKKLKNGEITNKEFDKIIRANPHAVSYKKTPAYTSKNSAKKKLGSADKAPIARQKVSRLKRKKESFFGKRA